MVLSSRFRRLYRLYVYKLCQFYKIVWTDCPGGRDLIQRTDAGMVQGCGSDCVWYLVSGVEAVYV
jgi:hypothetical protein